MSDSDPPSSAPAAAPQSPAPTLASLPTIPAHPRRRDRIFAHLRSSFITGLISLVPLFITAYLLTLLFGFATKFTRPVADSLVPAMVQLIAAPPPATDAAASEAYRHLLEVITNWTSPILALLIMVVLIYALGVLSIFTIGRRLLAMGEHFIENLPLIKGIYGTTKQVITVFRRGGGGAGFQRVVLVEFPRPGTWTIAFVTNIVQDGPQQLVCCFIPMTPNPTSGFFQMFPEGQVRNTDWSVDTGIKIILSGGLLAPHDLPNPNAAPPRGPAPSKLP
jgi:uncharacterized membrane protein